MNRYFIPDISVIITVYNRSEIFYRALNSLLNQTISNFEIIIVNDGSSDDFHIKIFDFLKYDYRATYLFQSNLGTVSALNSGLKIARGKFITFLDSDDEYKNNHLELRLNFMNSNPDIDLVYSDAELIGNESDFMIPDAYNQDKLINVKDCIIGATFFGKRKVFSEGFRNVFSHDSDFFKRISEKYKIEKLNYLTYIYYRNSPDGILNIKKNKVNNGGS